MPVSEPVSVPVSDPSPVATEPMDISNAPPPSPVTSMGSSPQSHTDAITLSFNDIDNAVDVNKNEFEIEAPKTISRLQEISDTRHAAAIADDDYDSDKLVISSNNVNLDEMDIQTIDEPRINILPPLLNDIEVLE